MMNQLVFLGLVLTSFIFGPKSACCMAIDSEFMEESSYLEEEHHRSRRAVLSNHLIVVTASPYMTTSYYFNRNEPITFKVRVSYNGTDGDDYTDLNLHITSDWIDLSQGSVTPDMFTSGSIQGSMAILNKNTLKKNEVMIGNVTGVVKADIGPLSSLELNIEMNATQGVDTVHRFMSKSSPTVYGVFPEVNMTRGAEGPINVYDELSMSMKLQLPVLDYSLLVELTTNIEEYVFMELKDVTITSRGTDIISDVNATIKTFSSQLNTEIDRAEINFHNISIPTSGSTEEERTIVIDFKVVVKDHELVVNGSTHFFGAGLQAGPKVLWVDQYEVVVLKDEPALQLSVTSDQTLNNTRLSIGDIVTFDVNITHHVNTSSKDAKNLKLGLITDMLYADIGLTQVSGITWDDSSSNDTFIKFDLGHATLSLGDDLLKQVKVKVKNTITPLLDIPVKFYLYYENEAATAKRPVQFDLEGLVTSTPVINYYIKDHNDTIRPGEKIDFVISILMVKMKSPLEIELVMPKADDEPIMAITEFKILNSGSNLVGVQTDAQPTKRATTSVSELHDQMFLNLGEVHNSGASTADIADNQINLQFSAYLNDYSNVTDGSEFWVGAGVIGRPKMVWVGQIKVNVEIQPDPKPIVAIDMSYSADTDEYYYAIDIKHANESQQIAYNLTFEYYLPPYVEFVSEKESSTGVSSVSGTRYKFDSRMFYFTDSIQHSINVKLNRDKSPKTGKFDFVVPVRVSYQNRLNEWKEFFRAVNRSIEVLPRRPTIPVDGRAKLHYYGRGFYWDKSGPEFYVCMNQHVVTATPACYKLHTDKNHFIAVDRRIGCVLGKASSDSKLYALARNQITAMVFNDVDKDWYPIPDTKLPAKSEFFFKDLTGTTSIGAMSAPDAAHEEENSGEKWQGTGDGLYFQPSGGAEWQAKAKWYL